MFHLADNILRFLMPFQMEKKKKKANAITSPKIKQKRCSILIDLLELGPTGECSTNCKECLCWLIYRNFFNTFWLCSIFFLYSQQCPYRCCCDFLVQILRSQLDYFIIFSDTFCFSSVYLCIHFLEPQPIAGQTQRDRQFCVTNHPNIYAFRLWEEAGSFEPTCEVLVLLFYPPNWQSHWLYTHIKCVYTSLNSTDRWNSWIEGDRTGFSRMLWGHPTYKFGHSQ